MPATALSLEDLAALASAPETVTAAELAARLGKPFALVRRKLHRVRRSGWSCPVGLARCPQCGLRVAGPPGRRVHVGCEAAWRTRGRREQRRRRAEQHPEAAERARLRVNEHQRAGYAAWTPEQTRLSWARAHEVDRQAQQATRGTATRTGAAWTAEEDRYLLDHPNASAGDVALALGRTLHGVRKRRLRPRAGQQ